MFEYFRIVESGERNSWTAYESQNFDEVLTAYEKCSDYWSPKGTGIIYLVRDGNEIPLVSSIGDSYEVYDEKYLEPFTKWAKAFHPDWKIKTPKEVEEDEAAWEEWEAKEFGGYEFHVRYIDDEEEMEFTGEVSCKTIEDAYEEIELRFKKRGDWVGYVLTGPNDEFIEEDFQ